MESFAINKPMARTYWVFSSSQFLHTVEASTPEQLADEASRSLEQDRGHLVGIAQDAWKDGSGLSELFDTTDKWIIRFAMISNDKEFVRQYFPHCLQKAVSQLKNIQADDNADEMLKAGLLATVNGLVKGQEVFNNQSSPPSTLDA